MFFWLDISVQKLFANSFRWFLIEAKQQHNDRKRVFSLKNIKIADGLAVYQMTCDMSCLLIKIVHTSIFIFEIFSI